MTIVLINVLSLDVECPYDNVKFAFNNDPPGMFVVNKTFLFLRKLFRLTLNRNWETPYLEVNVEYMSSNPGITINECFNDMRVILL
jgi:hypothetical protein